MGLIAKGDRVLVLGCTWSHPLHNRLCRVTGFTTDGWGEELVEVLPDGYDWTWEFKRGELAQLPEVKE